MSIDYTRPQHYQKISAIGKPIIDIFEVTLKEDCFKTIHYLEKEKNWSFDLLNAFKYLWRLGQKGSKSDLILDLNKIIDYLESEFKEQHGINRELLTNMRLQAGPSLADLWLNTSISRIFRAWEACLDLLDEISTPTWFEELEAQRDRYYELFGRSRIYDPLNDGLSALQLVDVMGRDLSVANDARSSFNKESSELNSKDEKLINYLANATPAHSSPFRGCVLKFKVSATLSIARQWWKHAVASAHIEDQNQHNEQSFRYTELTEPRFYVPKNFRAQSESNRQCSGDYLPIDINERIREMAFENQARAHETYKTMLALGVSREQARDHLPIGTYTTWVWTVSLQALLNFLELRKGSGAQTEIKAYADTIEEILIQVFPVATKAWLSQQ
jgi:thymidylate synthase (FAD)